MSFQNSIYQIADELRAVASLGLQYSEDPHARERYEKVMSSSARLLSLLDERPLEDVLSDYDGSLQRSGPQLTSAAALFVNDRLALVKRSGADLWSLPRGVVHADELLSESAERSLREQTGIVGKVTRLSGLFDSRAWGYPSKAQFYQAVFDVDPPHNPSAKPEDGNLRFVSADEVAMLSPGIDPIIPRVFDLHHGKTATPYFDRDGQRSVPVVGVPCHTPPAQESAHSGEMLRIVRGLENVGTAGLDRPEHPYALERYRHVLLNSARLDKAVKEWSADEVSVRYEDNINTGGIRLGAFAAAFLDGKILLIRREDTGLWSMPAGGVDVGETWANCARRELHEETDVAGRVVDLLALFDFRVQRQPPRPLVMAAFLARIHRRRAVGSAS